MRSNLALFLAGITLSQVLPGDREWKQAETKVLCFSPDQSMTHNKQCNKNNSFHGECIHEFIKRGGDTCPMCCQSFIEVRYVAKVEETIKLGPFINLIRSDVPPEVKKVFLQIFSLGFTCHSLLKSIDYSSTYLYPTSTTKQPHQHLHNITTPVLSTTSTYILLSERQSSTFEMSL